MVGAASVSAASVGSASADAWIVVSSESAGSVSVAAWVWFSPVSAVTIQQIPGSQFPPDWQALPLPLSAMFLWKSGSDFPPYQRVPGVPFPVVCPRLLPASLVPALKVYPAVPVTVWQAVLPMA